MKKKSQLSEFNQAFDTDEKCLQYLCDLKWSDGFTCRKCGHMVSVKGRKWYYKRCQKCKYDESCFANTLFHKLKIPITSAFMLVYQLSTLKKGMSCCEISRQHQVHLKTAWFFKSKVQKAMNADAFRGFNHYLNKVEVVTIKKDKSENEDQIKIKVKCSVQKDQKAMISSVQLNFSYTEEEKWNKALWLPVKSRKLWNKAPKTGFKIDVELSQADASGSTNLYIYNLRNWLAGIHHLVSLAHLQRYLNEFQYKYDRRRCPGAGSREILAKVVELGWMPYKCAKAN